MLGVLAAAVVLVSGRTWGVTFAFALWGAKLLQLVGLHPETWEFWQTSTNAKALAGPIWTDKTNLTDLGIILGAAVAASAAGTWRIRCNIGAYLAGISTGSLHGWLWGLFALGGTWIGLRLRPLFGLTNPQPAHGVC